MGGGAWPFLVGGVICLVDSDNERDSCLVFGMNLLVVLINGVTLCVYGNTCITSLLFHFSSPYKFLTLEQTANQAVRERAITGL